VPDGILKMVMGRFGLPKLPRAAINHIKFPVVIDDRSFREATKYRHQVSEVQCMHDYRAAFPVPTR
jgi:UDP-glucose 4-epimerase